MIRVRDNNIVRAAARLRLEGHIYRVYNTSLDNAIVAAGRPSRGLCLMVEQWWNKSICKLLSQVVAHTTNAVSGNVKNCILHAYIVKKMYAIENVARNKLKIREHATKTVEITSSNMARRICVHQGFEHVLVPVGLVRLLFARSKRSRRRDAFGSGA